MGVTAADGRAVRVKRLKSGDHFGYDALLADTHDTTVSCLTDVELTAVPQEDLRLASQKDGVGGYLSQTVAAQNQRREQATRAAVETQQEAQILPLMAQAAARGGGVEYDKYEQMLAQMATVKYAKPHQSTPNSTKPCQTKLHQAMPSEAKPGHTKPTSQVPQRRLRLPTRRSRHLGVPRHRGRL